MNKADIAIFDRQIDVRAFFYLFSKVSFGFDCKSFAANDGVSANDFAWIGRHREAYGDGGFGVRSTLLIVRVYSLSF